MEHIWSIKRDSVYLQDHHWQINIWDLQLFSLFDVLLLLMLCLLLNITQSINRRVYHSLFLFPLSVHHWQIILITRVLQVFEYLFDILLPLILFYWLLNIKQSIRRRVYQMLFLFPLCCPPLQTNDIYELFYELFFCSLYFSYWCCLFLKNKQSIRRRVHQTIFVFPLSTIDKCRLHLPAKKYTQNPFFPTSNNI